MAKSQRQRIKVMVLKDKQKITDEATHASRLKPITLPTDIECGIADGWSTFYKVSFGIWN